MYFLRYRHLNIPLIFLLFIASIFLLQRRIDSYKGRAEKIEALRLLPPGRYIRPLTLGYNQMAADLIWLKAIQLIGEKEISPEGYDWIYHVLNVVTDLDPKFDYAYQVGGVVLATLGDQFDKSNALLEKGLKENPKVWQIPFYLGFNHFFYLKDYKRAADYMSIASQLPGSPRYVPFLASRLYTQAKDPDTGMKFLSRVYENTRDERIRAEIEVRIKELKVEKDLQILEEAAAKYKEKYGNEPAILDYLVKEGFIQEIPEEPFDGYYYVDPKTREIKSSSSKERLKVHDKN